MVQTATTDKSSADVGPKPTPSILSRIAKSIILYAESCLVDKGGLLEGCRMNMDDMAALDSLQRRGALTWGRIPSQLLGAHRLSSTPTHWVRFTPEAWALAGQLRQERASHLGPYSTSVFEAVSPSSPSTTHASKSPGIAPDPSIKEGGG